MKPLRGPTLIAGEKWTNLRNKDSRIDQDTEGRVGEALGGYLLSDLGKKSLTLIQFCFLTPRPSHPTSNHSRVRKVWKPASLCQ
ncbi:MAG TPA: hypothetical protein VMV04_11000 [Thermodesulfobacteriota bacterium]|nr:hypothetical protein [Thermodesulfobacteriota bacterium]